MLFAKRGTAIVNFCCEACFLNLSCPEVNIEAFRPFFSFAALLGVLAKFGEFQL